MIDYNKMTVTQLNAIIKEAEEVRDEKLARFDNLCINLREAIAMIDIEFPNANIYLEKSPYERINIMEYIVPQNFLEICEIDG